MWVLQQARHADEDAGIPLPTVFEHLKSAGVEFRRSGVHLVVAAPGVGKSVLALREALGAGVQTLYFSADSDATTQYGRAASMITGDDLDVVNRALEDKAVTRYDMALNHARHIRFVFDPNPSIDDLNQHVMAYGWAFGMWPELIIVDNVSNVFAEETGRQGLEEVMGWLHQLARKTGACIIGLHHVTGEYEAGDLVVPMSGVREKISKLPVLVLSLNRVYENDLVLNIAVLKNRTGMAAANGTHSVRIGMDLSRMWLETKMWRGSQ